MSDRHGQIRARLAALKGRPWHAFESHNGRHSVWGWGHMGNEVVALLGGGLNGLDEKAHAAFIVAAPDDIEALLAECERLTALAESNGNAADGWRKEVHRLSTKLNDVSFEKQQKIDDLYDENVKLRTEHERLEKALMDERAAYRAAQEAERAALDRVEQAEKERDEARADLARAQEIIAMMGVQAK